MPIKKYKLVPIDLFERLGGYKNENCTKTEDEIPHRSVKNIIDYNLNNSEFKPTTHHVAEETLKQGGAGMGTPIFLPDAKELPEFSRGSRLKRSYDKVTDILDNESISDDLKIKIYKILKQKYDNNRVEHLEETETVKHDAMAMERSEIREIVNSLPAGKRRAANRVMDVFLKHPNHIKWNVNGDIILPNIFGIDTVSPIKRLLELMVYTKRGVTKQIDTSVDIIRPFKQQLQPFILNTRILDELYRRGQNARFSKYVSWK